MTAIPTATILPRIPTAARTHPKAFTDNKRIVYGGGGINPDITVKEKSVGNIVGQLFAQSVFFEFAAKYSDKHPELNRSFEVNEALLNEFKLYVDTGKNFKYSIPGKTYLDRFRDTIKREKYDGEIVKMVDSLEKAVAAKRDDDFWANRDTVKRILKREIASARFGSAERAIASKEWDVQLQKAIEVLNDPALYSSILTTGGAPVKTGSKQ